MTFVPGSRLSWKRSVRYGAAHEQATEKRGIEMTGPLAGMRVIELAHIMSGPVCGMMLADMGADVIKVEKSPDGDDSRRFAPVLDCGESASFMIVNRNKRGIGIDLK